MVHLVHRHDDGGPGENDQRNIENAACGTEGLAAGKLILEAVLVQRLGQQDQRKRKGQVDAALSDIVVKAVEARPDVEQRHTEGKHGGDLDKDVSLALFQGLRSSKLTVELAYVDLLVFFFLVVISHMIFLSLRKTPVNGILML